MIAVRHLFFTAPILPLLALACAPVERTYPTSSGGSDSSGLSAVAATSSAASTGGTGGSGGGVPTGSCAKVGVPFDILTMTDLGAKAKLSSKLYLAADQESTAMVHVVVKDDNQKQLHLRTVVPGPKPLGNLAHYGNPGVPPYDPSAVWAVNGQLHIEGSLGNTLEDLTFDIDAVSGVKPDGLLTAFQTPIECLQSGTLGEHVFAQDGAKARYLAVCNPSMAPQPYLLYAGGWTGQPVLVASDVGSAPVMRPMVYAFVGGTHLAFFADNDSQSFFSYGADVTKLAKPQPFRLTADSTARHGVFFTAPLPGDDGVAILAAHFNLSTSNGQYWSGSTSIADYATLSQVPPPGLELAQNIPSLMDAVTPSLPGWDAKGIVSAGYSGDHKGVYLDWLTRVGHPIVFGQAIYTTTDTEVINAGAAVLGDTTLVVWIEQIGAGSPYQYLVRGQAVSCKLD